MMMLLDKLKKRADWEFHKYQDAIYRRIITPPYVMSYEECVEFVITNKASISRFGDGELGVIKGADLGFQKHNVRLGSRLRDVLTADINGLLTCIPDTFRDLKRYNLVEQNFWKAHHYYNRKSWMRLLVPGKKYGNTFLSRFYSMEFNRALSDCRLQVLKTLWNGRDIVFIEGRDTKLGGGNNLFDNARTIRRILCPTKDAFSRYDDIIQAAKSVEQHDNNLFIIALGPTATVLAADLHAAGLQAFDLGHIDIEYEWYRKGAKAKTPVIGKYSNEAAILGLADNPITGEIEVKDYEKQVIFDLTR